MAYAMSDITRNLLRLGSHPERLRPREFWAVDDVSFELKKGESLGLIGPNGSGKTTMLQMINGIFWPDKGRVRVRGKVGALIAVGAGFHPMLTGRENVYINAAILGMSKSEVDSRFDSIVDFADIGDFLDTPVKHYSSGMFVRLGFAVAAHCEPQVLLVDEVLAVGDREFQLKCYQKIHEVKKQGTTIVLVAHNEYTIREQTQQCVYLRGGKVRFHGPSEEGVSLYVRDVLEARQVRPQADDGSRPNGSRRGEIRSVKFLGRDGREAVCVDSGQELSVVVECSLSEALENTIVGVNFYGDDGFMYCANSYYEDVNFGELPQGLARFTLTIPHFHLPTNKYSCSVVLAHEAPDHLLDWHDRSYTMTVGRARNARGSLKLPTQWQVDRID